MASTEPSAMRRRRPVKLGRKGSRSPNNATSSATEPGSKTQSSSLLPTHHAKAKLGGCTDPTAVPALEALVNKVVPSDWQPSLRNTWARTKAAWTWYKAHEIFANYVILTVLSFCTRFYRLSHPSSVVFDEYHFGKFTNLYHSGKYFFDIHPPLGKLTLAFSGYLFGYDHTVCRYDSIQLEYDPACSYVVLRATAAFFGSLFPMLMNAIALLLGASPSGALLAGWLTIFDMLNVTEARLILTDSQLMFYIALSLYVGLKYWKTLENADKNGQPLTSRQNNLWLLALGMSCGAAVSIKWTALATPGMIAMESTFGIFGFVKKTLPFVDLLKVGAVIIVQYFFWFWWHFRLLPFSGEGDAFMPVEFQQTLIDGPNYTPLAPPVSFFWIAPELNREMLSANARIDTPHHWQSRWHQWVYNARGLLYWGKPYDAEYHQSVYLLGNPFVIWMCLFATLGACVTAFLCIRYRENEAQPAQETRKLHTKLAYCLVTYILNLFPYVAVSRAAFIYHYMPGLMYAQLITSLWLPHFFGRFSGAGVALLMGISAAGFLYWCPWVYGLPLTHDQHASRRWMEGWA